MRIHSNHYKSIVGMACKLVKRLGVVKKMKLIGELKILGPTFFLTNVNNF